jgi:hypothetical protein
MKSQWGFKFRKMGDSMGHFWDIHGYSTGIKMISTFSTGHGDKDSVGRISMEIGWLTS